METGLQQIQNIIKTIVKDEIESLTNENQAYKYNKLYYYNLFYYYSYYMVYI